MIPLEKVPTFLFKVTISHRDLKVPFVGTYEAATEFVAHNEAVAEFVRKTARTYASVESVHVVKIGEL